MTVALRQTQAASWADIDSSADAFTNAGTADQAAVMKLRADLGLPLSS